MGDVLQNEVGNTYGKWLVVGRGISNKSCAAWDCACSCGYGRSILGVDLRRNKIPLCTNCCRVCGKTKVETEFKGNKKICKECDKKRIREWKKGNLEHKSKIDDWIDKNPEAINRHKKTERKRLQSKPEIFIRRMFKEKVRLTRYLPKSKDKRAQQKTKSPERRIITITEDAVMDLWGSQAGLCAISGMPMLYQFKNPRTVSIDRIDSEKGYIPDNVQLICRWVNLAKNNFSDVDIRKVLREFKGTR